MLSIDPKTYSERENYKLLTTSILPRPIAFVTSITKEGVVNGAPFSYFNIVSSAPPRISIAVQRKNGKPKDTARNILEQKTFVVHLVEEGNVNKIHQTAASLQPDESEIHVADLSLVPSKNIATPSIREANVRIECILEQAIPLQHETEVGTDLLIGQIVHYHLSNHVFDDGKVNLKNFKPVSRLGGANYATVGDIFSIERPI